ncbi:AI-2E family transporter [Halomicroarcula sp. GCM10025817]|uniref:AI-2E family transporter n=1 Tax=Haloarcula TaxID=2237 RepID=UPI00360ECB46
MRDSRRPVLLATLLAGALLLAMAMLSSVLATIFFAITVAYVLYPLSGWLVDLGLSKRLAAAVATAVAFGAGTAIAVPLGAVVYLRRRDLFAFFRQLPDTVTLEVGGMVYVLEVEAALGSARGALTDAAVELAAEAPVLALKVVLFTILVYAILWRPTAPREEIFRMVPPAYHDVLHRLHERLRSTLYAIYVLQAATAFGTFMVAWVFFAVLGLPGAFALAVLAGILQFVPIVGPSIVVVAIGVAQAIAGDVIGAVLLVVFGLVVIGFMPDAVIRPRLARYTTGMPTSLYFVGFVGGLLSLGAVGFIAGPVIIGLLVELLDILTDEQVANQHRGA